MHKLILCLLFFALQFRVSPDSVRVDEAAGVLTATLYSAVDGAPPFALSMHVHENGMARMRIVEKNELPARWEVSERLRVV